MDEVKPEVRKTDRIKLSSFTNALIKNILAIKKKPPIDENSKILVSNTVSFFAIVYEKIRNAVEYREEHLIRRAAIERILKRHLLLNPGGRGEAENLLRELLWARYFPNGSLSLLDVDKIQVLIDLYVKLREKLTVGQVQEKRSYYAQFLFDLLTCEIEETLDPVEARKTALYTFYVYQVLRKKIKIEKVPSELKDAYFYVGVERGYAKSDNAYLRYHLYVLSHKPFGEFSLSEIDSFATQLPSIFGKIERIISAAPVERLTKFVRQNLPPFSILFSTINRNINDIEELVTNKELLWSKVDQICRDKYQQTGERLRNLGIRSLIYIFLTKMLFAIALEWPLSQYFYNEVNLSSIAINTLFPPFLMLLIISFVRIPGEDNTKRVFERIVHIINYDTSYETDVTYIIKPPRVKKPMLILGFTIFYLLTFIITLGLIHEALTILQFNAISESIFIFFVSIISFFGYRVKQIAKEYRLQVRESFFAPFVDFFFMPILSLGKFFSSGLAKLNIFMVILDFLIEAPFKLIFEIVEEWISFVRQRKDEIV